eukprot:TRINITY_DN1099_c0_g1_i9.p1 TRINITY_DN1099_c0_g1~~TRINITY_DN1099_c0_g1_i9.p1  ORF type:complete len:269 (+),score=37.15 TRINITY_DN1099_c0_g1_i9:481-1287(+)
MTCNLNNSVNATTYCKYKPMVKRLAGEKYVYTSMECLNRIADDKQYCRGKLEGASCSNYGDAECDVDLYCDSEAKICRPVAREDEDCNEAKCASNLVCARSNLRPFERYCKSYGIFFNGHILASDTPSGVCRSNYKDERDYCQTGPVLVGSNLKENEGMPCEYNGGQPGKSQCWFHARGKAICRRGAGDLMDDWKKAVAYLRLSPKCHVSAPMAQCDMGREVMSSQEEWEDAWSAISTLHLEERLEGMPECVRQHLYPDAFKYSSTSK